MEGVTLAKGITNTHSTLAHGLGDIQRYSLDSSLFIRKRHHLKYIHSVLDLVPIEYLIHMYVLERAPTWGLPTHSTSTKKRTMIKSNGSRIVKDSSLTFLDKVFYHSGPPYISL